MKIALELLASEARRHLSIDTFSDLGYSAKDWEELSQEQKDKELQSYVDSLPEQPYWYVSNSQETE